jgi:hypothetical protein
MLFSSIAIVNPRIMTPKAINFRYSGIVMKTSGTE